MTRADNAQHLQRAATARHDTTINRARAALEELDRTGQPITFPAVARTARVSRSWLYQQPELRDTIIRLRADPHRQTPNTTTTPAAQRTTPDSLRQRLDTTKDEIRHLRTENAALRDQLVRSLGDQRTRP